MSRHDMLFPEIPFRFENCKAPTRHYSVGFCNYLKINTNF